MRTIEQKGYVLLYMVIIVAAIATVVATTLISTSLASSQGAASVERSGQARALANACAELAIQRLITSALFVGTVPVTLGSGSCTYTISSSGAGTSLITATGTAGTTVRRVQIGMQLVPLTVLSWQEVR